MKLLIAGVPPYDGEYSMDFTFTNREMHRIKEIAGLRGGEVFDALVSADMGGYVAVTTVVLERNGTNVDVDLLWEAESGSIRIVATSDAGPPAGTSSGGSSEDPNENERSSGPDSTTSGG